MKTSSDLRKQLSDINYKSYPAYKSLQGQYSFPEYILSVDHVQGDPFAAPSKLRLIISSSKAGFPTELYDTPHKRIALQDHLLRLFCKLAQKASFQAKGSGKSGLISVTRCGQEVIERTACAIYKDRIELRFEAGFPANGRKIQSTELEKMLFTLLPDCARKSLYYKNIDADQAAQAVLLAEDQHYIREQLPKLGLISFVANGAVLPRATGVSDQPLKDAVPFLSPSSLCVELDLPNRGKISGMGIRQGITLIVGGGYHGKSTLLKALEKGVYNHIAGDGREYVITDNSAVKIRAEDGRSIKNTDISLFINHLPNQKDTSSFYTEDASGSTSQAANVIEAIESGAKTFLIDEDTTATNFMVRDPLMQQVIKKEKEPITPFIERIRYLYESLDISTVLVAGSSGTYFYTADTVIQMDCYEPKDITVEIQKLCRENPEFSFQNEENAKVSSFQRRIKKSKNLSGRDRIKIKCFGKDSFQFGHETVDLRYVEQIADAEQTAALAYILKFAAENLTDSPISLSQLVEDILARINQNGLASIAGKDWIPTPMAMPRKQEIFSCFNRYRSLNCI